MSLSGRGRSQLNETELLGISPHTSLEIRSGLRAGWSSLVMGGHIFGLTTTETTISAGLPVNGINILTFPAAAAKLGIASSSASDTSAGTGARTIELVYLDSNHDQKFETITLNGTTPVTTVADMLRVNFSTVLTAGSGGSNVGDIYVGLFSDTFTGGAPDTAIFHSVGAGSNFSSCGLNTVPRGKKYYIANIDESSTATSAKPMAFFVYISNSKFSPLRLLLSRDIVAAGSFFFQTPCVSFFDEMSDLEVTGKTDSGTVDCQIFLNFFIQDK